MTKRKTNYPQAETEETPEIREQLEGFTEEVIKTGVVAGGFASDEPRSEAMEKDLFGGLMESLREAGAILRGELEAARRTRIDSVSKQDPANEPKRETGSERASEVEPARRLRHRHRPR